MELGPLEHSEVTHSNGSFHAQVDAGARASRRVKLASSTIGRRIVLISRSQTSNEPKQQRPFLEKRRTFQGGAVDTMSEPSPTTNTSDPPLSSPNRSPHSERDSPPRKRPRTRAPPRPATSSATADMPNVAPQPAPSERPNVGPPAEVQRFSIQPVNRFRGASASIKRPREVAHFSYDDNHQYQEDESGINYYIPPPMGADLKEGFETFRHYEDKEDPHLDSLLKALLSKQRQEGSEKRIPGDFVTWRGMMTKVR